MKGKEVKRGKVFGVKVKVSAGPHSKAFHRTLKHGTLSGLFELGERHKRKVQEAR